MRDCILFVKSYLWESYLWESYLEVCDIDLFRDRRYALRGNKLVSESTICIGLLPINSSLFEFLLLQSHSSSTIVIDLNSI